MTGYVRVDTGNNIDNGNVIDAFYLDGEFDGVQDAFHATTGHSHGGSAGEGAPILVIGPAQDFVAGASSLLPKTDNTYDLGSASFSFKDAHIQGTVTAGTFSGALAATSLTGTIASARISGSYTGITGTGALDAGSITSGFGSINIGTDTLACGNTTVAGSVDATVDITAAGKVESGQVFASTTNNVIITNNGSGLVYFRPQGAASTTGQMIVANDGNVTISGTLTTTGAITGSFSASNLTGTVANARLNGSYTSVTGVGALNVGSITSGFGSINIGSDTLTAGATSVTTLTASGTITSSERFVSSSADVILSNDGTGSIALRPNGVSSSVNQTSINNSGNMTVGGTITATGGFIGDGSNLSDLSASQLTTGTVPTARISGSYTSITGVGTLSSLTVDNISLDSNTIFQTVTNSSVQISGGTSASGSGHITLYGASHATQAANAQINGDSIQFRTSAGSEVARLSSSNLLIGTTTQIGSADTTNFGIDARPTGVLVLSGSGLAPLFVKRSNDGTVASWIINGVTAGTVSTSGGTVTYGTFCGDHWSQYIDGGTPSIYRGTVVDSANEVGDWDSGSATRLPKFKISDTPGSKAVYGVFMGWDDDNPELERAHVAALGAYLVRVRYSVEVGDLLESAGDGTARVQGDDVIKSSTIGKVISNKSDVVYPDGSWLVPVVLYCG